MRTRPARGGTAGRFAGIQTEEAVFLRNTGTVPIARCSFPPGRG